jgi:hypothetical protein
MGALKASRRQLGSSTSTEVMAGRHVLRCEDVRTGWKRTTFDVSIVESAEKSRRRSNESWRARQQLGLSDLFPIDTFRSAGTRRKTTKTSLCMHVVQDYIISRTKPKVPNEEASSSSTLALSLRCASSNVPNRDLISSLAMIVSPCIRRNTFCRVCTASKSRRDRSRPMSASKKCCMWSSVTRERSSRSNAAGEIVLT